MDTLLQLLNTFLDVIFYNFVSPLFTLLGQGLELLLLRPMLALQFPPALQVACIAVLTALLSLGLRRLVKAEEKDLEFRQKFIAKKQKQEDLHLISDWKSREKFAKVMDDDIDEDFNSYLAGRFARYGIAYLLPIFLSLYWLETFTGYTQVINLPENGYNLTGIPVMVVYLTVYCLSLLLYFKVYRKRRHISDHPMLTV